MPRGALHDGAVIIHGDTILAAGAVLPLSEISVHQQRYGTRHRAAIGISEQTDALVVVVSEETGSISLVERGRVIRDLDEDRLRTSLVALLRPAAGARRAAAGISALGVPLRGKRNKVARPAADRHPAPTTAGPAATPSPAVPDDVAPMADESDLDAPTRVGPQG